MATQPKDDQTEAQPADRRLPREAQPHRRRPDRGRHAEVAAHPAGRAARHRDRPAVPRRLQPLDHADDRRRDLRRARLGPQHRRRLHRPARPRLRGLLRHRRLLHGDHLQQGPQGEVRRRHRRLLVADLDQLRRRRPAGRARRGAHRLPDPARARRLPGHHDAGLRRDHPHRGHQLGRAHAWAVGHLRHPQAGVLRLSRSARRRASTSSAWPWRSISLWTISRIVRSRIGRAWTAIREDEVAAEAMGIHTSRYKLLSYATGAFFAGAMGVFFGHYLNYISPSSFMLMESFLILSLVVLGGMGNIAGPVLGADRLDRPAGVAARLPLRAGAPRDARHRHGAHPRAPHGLPPAGPARVAAREAGDAAGEQGRGRARTTGVVRCRQLRTRARARPRAPGRMPSACCETTQLVKAFGGLVAVNKVDFHADENEIVGLIGPNGAGKTTLFNAITGVYAPTSGVHPLQGPRHRRPAALQGDQARHRAHVPEHPPVQRDDGARERDGGPALPLAHQHAARHRAHARGAA